MATFSVNVSEKQVAAFLSGWFCKPIKRRWSTAIGRELKGCLQLTGNWKNAPRGNPKKGFAKMVESKKNEG